ncbi:unnamed protein product [Closterium sp. Yama58-4]|nr:unnamed protein product [Closterium sp. Yama58-4]
MQCWPSQQRFTCSPPSVLPLLPPGLSNTAGTLAGITSTVATGYMVEMLGSFHAVLAVTAVLYVLATAFWLAFATADVSDAALAVTAALYVLAMAFWLAFAYATADVVFP